MEKIKPELLREVARQAARNAHAPYSHFTVGAALLTDEGKIYRGCNVEDSSFGLTVCAERNAIAAALVDGAKHFRALGIYSPTGATPCGACRQVIWDICGDIDIFLFDKSGNTRQLRSADLLPLPFDDTKMEDFNS